METGESDNTALVREMREETGLEIQPGELVGTVERAAPAGVFEIHDYACVVLGGELTAGDDASAVAWVDGAGFAAMERDGLLVAELAETLRGWGVLPA